MFCWPVSFFMTVVYGHEDLVVHVHAAGAGALGRHDAEHAEDLVAHANLHVGRVDALAEQLFDTFEPSTMTLAAAFTSSSVKNVPYFERPGPDGRQVDVRALDARVPVLVAVDELQPRADALGDVLDVRAGRAAPARPRAPAACCCRRRRGRRPRCALPARTVIRFVPAVLTCSSICACAPVPSATIAMTAATPMIMPSMVSAVRILLRASALKAIRSVMSMDMVMTLWKRLVSARLRLRVGRRRNLVRLGRRQRRQLVGRVAPVEHRLVGDDAAVAEADEPRAVLGDVHLVRDEQHRDARAPGSAAGRCP